MVLAVVVLSVSATVSLGSWYTSWNSQSHTLMMPDTAEQDLPYLDAMKGVMSSTRGKDTYVVIFRRSLAECSNRYRNGGEKRNVAVMGFLQGCFSVRSPNQAFH